MKLTLSHVTKRYGDVIALSDFSIVFRPGIYGILCFPALLIILGADVFKWISPAVPVAQAELLWGLGSGKVACVIPGIMWLIIGAGAGAALTRVRNTI